MQKNVQIKATEECLTRLLFCRFVISIRSVFSLDGVLYSIYKLLDVSFRKVSLWVSTCGFPPCGTPCLYIESIPRVKRVV